LNAASVDVRRADFDVARFAASALGDDLSGETRSAIQKPGAPIAVRAGLLLGSPEFQRR
jgi:hypothetical protein